MFRMPPQIDPAEEKKRVQADVRNNFIMFTILCLAIRLEIMLLRSMYVPIVSRKIERQRHHVSRYQFCPNFGTCWNRDVNAGLNIIYLGECAINETRKQSNFLRYNTNCSGKSTSLAFNNFFSDIVQRQLSLVIEIEHLHNLEARMGNCLIMVTLGLGWVFGSILQ